MFKTKKLISNLGILRVMLYEIQRQAADCDRETAPDTLINIAEERSRFSPRVQRDLQWQGLYWHAREIIGEMPHDRDDAPVWPPSPVPRKAPLLLHGYRGSLVIPQGDGSWRVAVRYGVEDWLVEKQAFGTITEAEQFIDAREKEIEEAAYAYPESL